VVGNRFLTLERAKLAEDSFPLTCFKCGSHDKNSSKWMPTNLKELCLHPSPILSIVYKFILSSRLEKSTCWSFFRNRMYLVFDTYKVSLFALNQSDAFSSSRLANLNKSCRLLDEIWNVVSSANKSEKWFCHMFAARSFIRIRKVEAQGQTPAVLLTHVSYKRFPSVVGLPNLYLVID